jgi:acetyltransferase-like isoleucine patch superfamily enzyme
MIYEPAVLLKPEMIRYNDTVRVDSFCKIEGGLGVTLGAYVHIASFCHINAGGGHVTIADHAGLASHVVVCGGMPDLHYLDICPQEPVSHPLRLMTVIGAYVFIGAGAVILPGVSVEMGAVIGAGAVVTRDVPPFEVWIGNPARFLHKRKVYERHAV